MKRAIIIIFFAIFFVPSILHGQVEKQVEVTKAFVPKLDKASKLTIHPDMSDTVKMRPEIDYSITPLTLKTKLATRTIKPATVTYWEFNRPKPIYVKVGGGYPASSLFDFYFSSQNPSTGYVVGYANHDGRYAKIKNDFGVKRSARYMSNSGGVIAGKYLGRQTIEIDASYNNYLNSRYGAHRDMAEITETTVGSKVNYGVVGVDLRYGDDFVDLSRFNFNIAVGGSMFMDHSDYAANISNIGKARQIDWNAEATVARMFGSHKLLLDASYQVMVGQKAIDNYSQNTLKIGFHYGYDGDLMDIELGADYYRDDVVNTKANSYFIPQAKLSFNLGDGAFIPYVSLSGELRDNSYESLIKENPYVRPPSFLLESSVDYNLRLGVEGNLSYTKFAYRLFVGWSILHNHNYWYGLTDSNGVGTFSGEFMPYLSLLEVASLNGELAYRPIRNLLMTLEAHLYMYSDNNLEIKHGAPSFTTDLKFKYSTGRFSFGASAEFQSVREWSIVKGEYTVNAQQTAFVAPFSIDVKADVSCRISRGIDIFTEVGNIANMRLYEQPYYPEYGVNFTAGVKMSF